MENEKDLRKNLEKEIDDLIENEVKQEKCGICGEYKCTCKYALDEIKERISVDAIDRRDD